jgi:hypothetical protein
MSIRTVCVALGASALLSAYRGGKHWYGDLLALPPAGTS